MPKGIYKHNSPSLETRLKKSLKLKGKKRPAFSKEWIEKIAIKNKERKTKYWLGKKLSDEHRKKLSESHKGKGSLNGLSRSKEYKAIHRQIRRARIEQVGGSFTVRDWENLKAQYNWTCPCCHRKEPEIKLTIDHIIPVIKGGSNNIENIQPLCGSCNSIKGTKILIFKSEVV
jgi:5-methylcytosine-specific restriction endonuclease McrA